MKKGKKPEIVKPFADGATFEKRLRRQVSGRVREYYATVSPGFEAVCRQELLALGLEEKELVVAPGGVSFRGRFVHCQRANLYLRSATRILMRIDQFIATNPRQLTKRVAAVAWELFLPTGTMPTIKASSRHSRLYHSDAIEENVRAGLGRRWEGQAGGRPSAIEQTLYVRLVDDRVTLSLDSSGDPLYKRGFKSGPARAPLRESLAAAILMAAGYDASRPLVDPMCGSGSFSLEAALMAKGMAPGAQRGFAFEGWPCFGGRQWAYLLRQAKSQRRSVDQPLIFASDLDSSGCNRLVEAVQANALGDAVQVQAADFFHRRGHDYPGGPGLVVINPPYGVRIGSPRQAAELFGRICRHLADHFSGWDLALIVPHKELLRRLPFAARQIPFSHGGVRLTLALANLS